MPLHAVKAAKEAMKTLEEALFVPKKTSLFKVNLRIGDIYPFAFDPEKEILIVADSTEEFMLNLRKGFSKIGENPENIKKEYLKKLEASLADFEIKRIIKTRKMAQIEKDSEAFFN